MQESPRLKFKVIKGYYTYFLAADKGRKVELKMQLVQLLTCYCIICNNLTHNDISSIYSIKKSVSHLRRIMIDIRVT